MVKPNTTTRKNINKMTPNGILLQSEIIVIFSHHQSGFFWQQRETDASLLLTYDIKEQNRLSDTIFALTTGLSPSIGQCLIPSY